ncbi:hypothetical protein NAPIS_ORF00676 [Vairimorpha apis BRL 01]|uniref:Uncharacterized protein n=1 Tax=Vairimorpha apis BRL 01 TaxID=1037528 RepID=T0LBM4_9MICR|nr:hypothetical protein NAPIS_ORF00676 [Vairimorpha apis BRL 01]
MVLNADYIGFKLMIFVFMNIIMIFNLIKKTSVNVILLLFYYDNNLCANVLNRFYLMGNICTASLCKIFSFIYIDNENENYISIYSLIYKKSYYETVKELKNIKLNQKISVRLLLYPYVIISMFLIHKNAYFTFFSSYQKHLLIFESHILFIEIFFTIQAYIILNDHIGKEKPEI